MILINNEHVPTLEEIFMAVPCEHYECGQNPGFPCQGRPFRNGSPRPRKTPHPERLNAFIQHEKALGKKVVSVA